MFPVAKTVALFPTYAKTELLRTRTSIDPETAALEPPPSPTTIVINFSFESAVIETAFAFWMFALLSI